MSSLKSGPGTAEHIHMYMTIVRPQVGIMSGHKCTSPGHKHLDLANVRAINIMYMNMFCAKKTTQPFL